MNSLNILIVEDEMITAEDIQVTLESAGHKVICHASNFDEAINAVRHQQPDLAIIDISLENSSADGISTAREILLHGSIPIIFLTAHSEQQMVQRAKQLFPAAYLLKPFRDEELAIQIELAYFNFRTNDNAMDPAESDCVFLPINKGYEKIEKSKVLYLVAFGAYVNIFLIHEKESKLVTMNLGYLGQFFPLDQFFRVSRSCLINLNYLDRIERDRLFMADHKTAISIPEGNRALLMKKLAVIRTR